MDILDDAILERYDNPRFHGIEGAAAEGLRAKGENPLCGDTLELAVATSASGETSRVDEVRFEGYGCSLCLATADLLAERARGRTIQDVASWTLEDVLEAWGGLQVGRARAACARLPLSVLQSALAQHADACGNTCDSGSASGSGPVIQGA